MLWYCKTLFIKVFPTLKNIVTMISKRKSWYFGGILPIILFIFALFNLKYTYGIYLFSIYSVCFISVYILSVMFAKYIVQRIVHTFTNTVYYKYILQYIVYMYSANTLYVLQGSPQRIRLQRRLYGICLVRVLALRVHCIPKLAYFWA